MGEKTTFTTGYEKSKLYAYFNLLKYFRGNEEFALHDYHNVFLEAKNGLEQYIEKDIADVRILEVGCGQRFCVTLLFHSLGTDVVGIDTDYVDPRFSLSGLLSIWKINGFERFVKTIIRHAFFDKTYYRTLAKEFGRPLKMNDVDVRAMNACALEFPENHFDYTYSNAVFEHIDDIEPATSEIARVLVPGGIANIGIHLFPSLSGGHNFEWSRPDKKPSQSVPPWDHLRQNLFPTHAYLNKLREKDYIAAFSKHFSILNIESHYEGEQLLTEDIQTELSDYSREDLLKRSVRLVMRKEKA